VAIRRRRILSKDFVARSGTGIRIIPSCRDVSKSSPSRLRILAKHRAANLGVFREQGCVTLPVAAAPFVLDRSLRRQQERLHGKVDPGL
jgi:hypothetical protein